MIGQEEQYAVGREYLSDCPNRPRSKIDPDLLVEMYDCGRSSTDRQNRIVRLDFDQLGRSKIDRPSPRGQALAGDPIEILVES